MDHILVCGASVLGPTLSCCQRHKGCLTRWFYIQNNEISDVTSSPEALYLYCHRLHCALRRSFAVPYPHSIWSHCDWKSYNSHHIRARSSKTQRLPRLLVDKPFRLCCIYDCTLWPVTSEIIIALVSKVKTSGLTQSCNTISTKTVPGDFVVGGFDGRRMDKILNLTTLDIGLYVTLDRSW